MDRLTAWHRWVGLTIFWLVLLHPTLMIVGYARYDNLTVPAQFLSFAGVLATLMGMLAASIIVVVVALSIRFARRRLSYETWHAVHVCLYAAITLALIHQVYEVSTFKGVAHHDRLLVAAVGSGHRRAAHRADRHTAAAQRPPPAARRQGRPRVRQRHVGLYHRPRSRPLAGAARAVLHLAVPRLQHAGGRPTRSRSRRRPTASTCG